MGAVHITQRGHIIEESVYPHVYHMTRVEIHRNTPGKAGTGNAQVFQSRIDKIMDHLVDPTGGFQKIAGQEKFPHRLRVFGETEKVRFLFRVPDLTCAVGAAPVHKLTVGPEALTGFTVFAHVFSLVYVPFIVHFPENTLYRLHMIGVCGTDKAVVGNIHQFPESQNTAGFAVA